MRAAVERAWFEQAALRITYVDRDHAQTTRTIRVASVVMDRHQTRLVAIDLASGERRELRLDRIERAEVVRGVTSGALASRS